MDAAAIAATTLIFRMVLIVGVIVGVLMFFGKLENLIEAPIKAELAASRGNQVASKAATDAQGASIDARAAAIKAAREKSRKAVQDAGKAGSDRVARLRMAPALGGTDYERAVNRIDRELQLR